MFTILDNMQPILKYKICQNCNCCAKLLISFNIFEYFSKLYTKLYWSYLQMTFPPVTEHWEVLVQWTSRPSPGPTGHSYPSSQIGIRWSSHVPVMVLLLALRPGILASTGDKSPFLDHRDHDPCHLESVMMLFHYIVLYRYEAHDPLIFCKRLGCTGPESWYTSETLGHVI